MYISREITINLTKENKLKLEKPSKVFNKIKATFTKGMTPAEVGRAEVMLSVLQRVNKSLRAINIRNLVSLDINDVNIYKDEKGADNDLNEGVIAFTRDKNDKNITVFKSLEQVVEHRVNGILFIYHISIYQNPNLGKVPVTITVSGFPAQFKLAEGEGIYDFSSRITAYTKNNLSSGEEVKLFSEKHLGVFDVEVDRFENSLESYFPAGYGTEQSKVRLLDKSQKAKLREKLNSYFEVDILFMDYWLDELAISNFDDDFECKDLFDQSECGWINNDFSSEPGNSWIDSISDAVSDIDFSGDSSCGSSCGGGCGD